MTTLLLFALGISLLWNWTLYDVMCQWRATAREAMKQGYG